MVEGSICIGSSGRQTRRAVRWPGTRIGVRAMRTRESRVMIATVDRPSELLATGDGCAAYSTTGTLGPTSVPSVKPCHVHFHSARV